MLKISRNTKQLDRLKPQTLAAANILERYDLQEYLFNGFDAFCDEIRENLQIVGKEIRPSDVVQDRIDLLAIDEEGNAVIIELKRGSDRLQLLQAVAYAGMISEWDVDDFKNQAGERREAIAEFVEDDMNQRQRIILIAEEFDYEVLAGAEWLHENHDVDILCLRADLAIDDKGDSGKSEYLALTQIYPTKGLDEIAATRSRTRRISGGALPAHNEFLDVIAAYNDSAPTDVHAEGTAPNYRIIHPADWPFKKSLTYGFRRTGQGSVIQLSVHPDAPQGFEELLAPFDGRPVANGQASLVWDQERTRHRRGRLFAEFPLPAPAETVAQAMNDLITMTRTTVSNKLKASQAAAGSLGN